jgi:uncharacterized membrane protein YgcG
MNRSSRFHLGLLFVILLTLTVTAGLTPAAAQTSDGRSLRWDRYDVTINNIDTAANRFDVTETYALTIETGPFRFGYADIPRGRLTAIQNVAVYDGQTALQSSCSGVAGTFCVTETSSDYSINYYFLRTAQSGQQLQIRLQYTVLGALRSYSGGDQLYWVAVPSGRSFPVLASTVTVVMPPDRPPQVVTSYPDTWHQTINGNTITWQSPGSLGNNGSVEVRVQYPHDPRMAKPSWQAAYDREQSYIQNWQPIVSLLLLALSVLLTLGGILFIVLRYLRHGRDPQVLAVPEYVTEAPSDERPGIVGLLLDEKADMQDILATLVDLARQGYFVIEQTDKSSVLGMFASTEFEFHRTDKPATDLKGFEETLLNGLFPRGRQDTSLSDLRTKFYQYIPAIKEQMYTEVVKKDYFKRSPETTRNLWIFGGIGLAVLAAVAFWGALQVMIVSSLIILPPIGLGIVGMVAAGFGIYMPAKTLKGAQEAARWRAFRKYLEHIEKYTDLKEAAAQFEKYLPYAVALGIETKLVHQLVPVLTSMPAWYFPTYLGGPWYGGYRMGGPRYGGTGPGGLSMGGPGGLNDLSRSLTDGLNAMSGGLTHLLNSASSAMTEKPRSSGSGRFGGGFSGGGGHGGGSGGGSRGFG